MASGDNGGMNQQTAGNPPDPSERVNTETQDIETQDIETQGIETEPIEVDSAPGGSTDPLDEVELELERLAEEDPAESVAVLAQITAGLNREIDADQETS